MDADLIKATDRFLDEAEKFPPAAVVVVLAMPDGTVKVKGNITLAKIIFKSLYASFKPELN